VILYLQENAAGVLFRQESSVSWAQMEGVECSGYGPSLGRLSEFLGGSHCVKKFKEFKGLKFILG